MSFLHEHLLLFNLLLSGKRPGQDTLLSSPSPQSLTFVARTSDPSSSAQGLEGTFLQEVPWWNTGHLVLTGRASVP